MTLTQLKYIVAVARYKSFAQAAKQCLVAQPTLSLQIQKLEQEIGTEVFDRKKTPVVPTNFGLKVIEQAGVVLREADKVTELFRENDPEPTGELKIGIIPTISSYLMPKIFKALNTKYKQAEFRIYELPTSQITEQLESEVIELGILATPLHIKNMVETPLYYEPFVAYFPKDYKGKTKSLVMEDMNEYDLILLGEEHCFRNQSLRVCGRNHLSKIECGSIETIKNMVDSGAGMTLLPRLAVKKENHRIAHFKSPEPTREVSLLYKKGFYKKKLLKVIHDEILSVIPPELRTKKDRKVIGVET